MEGRELTAPVRAAEDRSMVVPADSKVSAAYVPIEAITLACRERMSVGDVERAMHRLMACAPGQPWPCPVGRWQDERFVIFDGRHSFVGAMMLGYSHILVAWVEQ